MHKSYRQSSPSKMLTRRTSMLDIAKALRKQSIWSPTQRLCKARTHQHHRLLLRALVGWIRQTKERRRERTTKSKTSTTNDVTSVGCARISPILFESAECDLSTYITSRVRHRRGVLILSRITYSRPRRGESPVVVDEEVIELSLRGRKSGDWPTFVYSLVLR